ncbi:murein transglycosylase [Terrabacter sp. BE26]|uniref:murein transglycosylase n=1 Tax=Terrabacter sp. BE26 TaxID=2898152 RepID=UPI0035BE4563
MSSASVAGLVLGLAFLGTSWVAGHGVRGPVDQPATRQLVDIVDATALSQPAVRARTSSGTRGTTSPRPDRVVEPDRAWVRRTAHRTGIPVVAVRAYGRASLLAARSRPGCGLGWTTLAAIGQVESAHGTQGGARLLPDGRTSTPVLGPALDGEGGVAAIRSDAEGQRLHGDATWDHAVGPMQFLMSSWRVFGADADGDGVADPTDIDDAAWAAARHLCAGGVDLRSGRGWTQAVLGYNASGEYVRSVFDVATRYARAAARS